MVAVVISRQRFLDLLLLFLLLFLPARKSTSETCRDNLVYALSRTLAPAPVLALALVRLLPLSRLRARPPRRRRRRRRRPRLGRWIGPRLGRIARPGASAGAATRPASLIRRAGPADPPMSLEPTCRPPRRRSRRRPGPAANRPRPGVSQRPACARPNYMSVW